MTCPMSDNTDTRTLAEKREAYDHRYAYNKELRIPSSVEERDARVLIVAQQQRIDELERGLDTLYKVADTLLRQHPIVDVALRESLYEAVGVAFDLLDRHDSEKG